MPARDLIHEAVKKALEKDGWNVTDDPLIIFIKEDNVAIDLAADKLLVAERDTRKIVVEIKSFIQPSLFYAFHEALGQYINYETALTESEENRQLYLAVSNTVYENLIGNYIIKKSIERCKLRMIVVDLKEREFGDFSMRTKGILTLWNSQGDYSTRPTCRVGCSK